MVIGPGEQEVATTRDIFIGHLPVRKRTINPTKYQKPSTWVKHRAPVAWSQDTLLRWRVSCCIWPIMQSKKGHNTYSASLDFGGNLFPCSGVIFLRWVWCSNPFTEWVRWKIACFESDLKKENVLQWSRLTCMMPFVIKRDTMPQRLRRLGGETAQEQEQ